jgi:hypothetical protein
MVTPITRKVQMSLKEVMMSLVQGDVISTGDNHDIVVVRTISNRAVLGYMCPYCTGKEVHLHMLPSAFSWDEVQQALVDQYGEKLPTWTEDAMVTREAEVKLARAHMHVPVFEDFGWYNPRVESVDVPAFKASVAGFLEASDDISDTQLALLWAFKELFGDEIKPTSEQLMKLTSLVIMQEKKKQMQEEVGAIFDVLSAVNDIFGTPHIPRH